MHVKMAREATSCTGVTPIPDVVCDCYMVGADWSLCLAWTGAVMCLISFAMWIRLTRMRAKMAATKL